MAFGKTGIDWRSTVAAVWRSNRHYLKPIVNVDLVDPESLLGIEEQKNAIYKNTENFLRGKASNHVLLWGARGVGKSSLIKAVLTRYHVYGLRMIQIPRDDLHLLQDITDDLHDNQHKFIVFCDDLSFDDGQCDHRQLKGMMEGNLEKPPANILIYATSNRRYLMSNTGVTANLTGKCDEAQDERLSLADRFGLTLNFAPMDEAVYLQIVDRLFKGRGIDPNTLHEEALRFATERGDKSGRIARQFYNHSMI
ncbi:MAG: ATP-binding protein [Thiofilum sp.]|uniref:ATP-binding protein n=1 Tax=Thiofilum sp. TaxID=2212733 RepID=UPI0025E7944E|nr:ATP-binding protein [Thiofilum sp.]MBK8452902.1 ATP-binding protein [Thiofilum sp.]